MTVKGMAAVQEQLKAARRLRGPAPAELTASLKSTARVQGALLAALKAGPRTVPQLAADTGLDSQELLWHVTALRKYGQVEEGPRQGDYPSYARKEQP